MAQYLATEAYRHAPAAIVAPFTYSGLLWAILLGYLIWGEVPDYLGFLGALLIVIAGVQLQKEGQREGPVRGGKFTSSACDIRRRSKQRAQKNNRLD